MTGGGEDNQWISYRVRNSAPETVLSTPTCNISMSCVRENVFSIYEHLYTVKMYSSHVKICTLGSCIYSVYALNNMERALSICTDVPSPPHLQLTHIAHIHL